MVSRIEGGHMGRRWSQVPDERTHRAYHLGGRPAQGQGPQAPPPTDATNGITACAAVGVGSRRVERHSFLCDEDAQCVVEEARCSGPRDDGAGHACDIQSEVREARPTEVGTGEGCLRTDYGVLEAAVLKSCLGEVAARKIGLREVDAGESLLAKALVGDGGQDEAHAVDGRAIDVGCPEGDGTEAGLPGQIGPEEAGALQAAE